MLAGQSEKLALEILYEKTRKGKLMSTPWPDDVFDCAVRLARSLGYILAHIWHKDGRVLVYCPTNSGDWRELDPRDPTVWGALIGDGKVTVLVYHPRTGDYSALTQTSLVKWGKHQGLAVCEAYNNLKGHPRRGK